MAIALSTITSRARIKARDKNKHLFTDDDLLAMANGILRTIHDTLVSIESNLVYAETAIALISGDIEFAPAFLFDSIMDDGVWIDGEDWYLLPCLEADKIKYNYDDAASNNEPERYFITEDSKLGFLPVPNDTYTVHIQYWKPLIELTAIGDDIPWDIWAQVIEEMLVVEMLEVQERDTRRRAVQLQILWDGAMAKTYQRGCRIRCAVSDFFTARGV